MGDEYYLQHPRKQKFYHYLALLMSYANLGDRRLLGYDKPPKLSFVNSKIILYFGPLVIASQLMYLYTNYDDLTFDTLGMFYTIFPATCLINVNIVISSNLKSYRNLIRMLFTEIHLYVLYEENKDDFVKKTLIKTERYTRWTTYYLIFFFLVNWLDWIGIPAVNNYNNRELVLNHSVRLQTCVYLWSPLDYSYDYQYWFIIHIINFYIVLCGVTVIATFQSLNNIFVYIIIGHIQIMKNMLRTSFPEDLSDGEVHKRLVKIIKYHAFITRVFKEIEYAFGFNVIGNYTQNLLGNSIVLYQLMYGGRENMVLYITMMMAYTGGPILMSFVLEEVKKQTDDLPEVVYNIPWEKMSVSNQKTVLRLLQHVQIVFEFEALGIMIAGVKPMFSILKTTFSYYVMLEKTIGKNN